MSIFSNENPVAIAAFDAITAIKAVPHDRVTEGAAAAVARNAVGVGVYVYGFGGVKLGHIGLGYIGGHIGLHFFAFLKT